MATNDLTLRNFVNKVEHILCWVSILMLIFLIVITCIDVITRNLLPIIHVPWIVEISNLMVLCVCFLGCPWLLRENGHVAFDLVINHTPPFAKRVVLFIGTLISIIATIFACYLSGRLMLSAISRGIVVRNFLNIPQWLFYFPILLGFVLSTYEFIEQFFRLTREIREGANWAGK